MLTGKHFIAGHWIDGGETFQPTASNGQTFCIGGPAQVSQAAEAADAAFEMFSRTSRKQRAAFLDRIAEEIEARAEDITAVGAAESALPEARLNNERGRTVSQLRMFARHIEKGDYLDKRHDPALPDREPPRPDLRMMQRPVGPVAVFGASNFPLAFSVAGGDTASALAAGCPVIVKGHPAHPGTGELVAQAITAAIDACDLPAGVCSFIQAGSHEAGASLVQHPLIKAVGFTGSLKGGRALFDLCVARPEPIPFFGEMGSINPMFILPQALQARGAEIAQGWVGSLTLGAGQFCTNPGVAVVLDCADADAFVQTAAKVLQDMNAQTMLTDGIAEACREGISVLQNASGVDQVVQTDSDGRQTSPNLFVTSAQQWFDNPVLGEEVFGPVGLIVKARDAEEMLRVARSLQGELTCTLHLDDGDSSLGQQLLPILERKAGRLLANGFPTGVEVCDAMVHGGPYPASTNFGATSVGTLAIRRFLRPVCYQNLPAALLPADLQA